MNDEPTSPVCPDCGNPMPLVRTIPHVAGFPELFVFYCAQCGHAETICAGANDNSPSVSEHVDGKGGLAEFQETYLEHPMTRSRNIKEPTTPDECQQSQHKQPQLLRDWHPLLHGAMQNEIGRALEWQYEIPRELPPQMHTLLKQLTEQAGQQ